MKWLGRVSQNEYFQSRIFGDFLRIMIGYFMSMMLTDTHLVVSSLIKNATTFYDVHHRNLINNECKITPLGKKNHGHRITSRSA